MPGAGNWQVPGNRSRLPICTRLALIPTIIIVTVSGIIIQVREVRALQQHRQYSYLLHPAQQAMQLCAKDALL